MTINISRMKIRAFVSGAMLMAPLFSWSQGIANPSDEVIVRAELCRQVKFKTAIPAGDYSGITRVGDDTYALVSDKTPEDGFFLFRLSIDRRTGRLTEAVNLGFRSSGLPNRDTEGIVFVPSDSSLFVSGEADNEVLEYNMQGRRTGRRLNVPPYMKNAQRNRGLEALAYHFPTGTFWTTTENALPADVLSGNDGAQLLRLLSFDKHMNQTSQYIYKTDGWNVKKKGKLHLLGVSALTALDDGRLLVLEREIFMGKRKIGSWVKCNIYMVEPAKTHETSGTISPQPLTKTHLCGWKTRMNLLHQDFANYEGMCLGPRLDDGRQVLILVADSQHQYGGLLRDWFKTIILNGVNEDL